MKEIGGYIELDSYHGEMLHSDGIKLNCGRNCLAYIIKARNIKKIAMPYYMCDSVTEVCREYGVQLRFYHTDMSFRPEPAELADDEWFYLMNFYGQLTSEEMDGYVRRYKRVIVDFAQDYFREPVKGADTLYTCRKFFGVPDGAILYTDAEPLSEELEQEEVFDRMDYLLGRWERPASEFYGKYVENNEKFDGSPIKTMSKLTENLLHAIDYEKVKQSRTENFAYLHKRLRERNLLDIRLCEGAFAYPFMTEKGAELRKFLISKKIFVPTLWPNVLEEMDKGGTEYKMVENILPLPCDQRYTAEDMEYIVEMISSFKR